MCAVLGLYNDNGIDNILLKNLLNQSMIRGKHATGIAWNNKGKLEYDIFTSSADQYDIPNIKTNMLIAHCRYSTSDLQYNQPITDKNLAIVHNGVITQSDPATWANTYDMQFCTKNDSEIVLRHWQKKIHPINIEGSMAVIVLDMVNENKLHFFRNEQRPLYWAKHKNHYVITSTKDIMKRSNINNVNKTESCKDYSIHDGLLDDALVRDCLGDLQ